MGDRQSALGRNDSAVGGDMSSVLLHMHTVFSMPLMGHISLGALCLLPNCKRYLALHLQEIPL